MRSVELGTYGSRGRRSPECLQAKLEELVNTVKQLQKETTEEKEARTSLEKNIIARTHPGGKQASAAHGGVDLLVVGDFHASRPTFLPVPFSMVLLRVGPTGICRIVLWARILFKDVYRPLGI